MSSPIKTYRICWYDHINKVLGADWLEAAGDEEAIAKASATGFSSKREIWDGRRLVAQIEAERLQA
jgi:hypothetical protein